MTDGFCLRVGDETIEVDVDPAGAPRTWAALAGLLPLRADLHYARIAGLEIMFIVPFLLPIEAATDVQDLQPGAALYWPERQLVCLYYGSPQEESATGTYLGQVRNLETLRAIGERVRERQGASAEVTRCP